MDPVLDKALKKQEKLRKELAEIERFIKQYRKLSGTGRIDESPQVVATESRVARKADRVDRVIAAIGRILKRNGRPMTRGEIADALAKDDIALPNTADPVRYVGTILWRENKEFENHGRSGYWLKGIPVPQDADERIKLLNPMPHG